MGCTLKQKAALFLLFSLAYGFFYILPNFWPPFPPIHLHLGTIDHMTPLIPWTFIIYLSLYLLELLTVLSHQTWDVFRPFARTAFGVVTVSGLFFLFFPTEYPRPHYPEVSNPVVALAMRLVHQWDAPTNCFPSMHVAITAISVWSLRYKGLLTTVFFSLWALAIFVSTLTTKQHYFVDILGGLAVAIAVIAVDWVVFSRILQGWVKRQVPVLSESSGLESSSKNMGNF